MQNFNYNDIDADLLVNTENTVSYEGLAELGKHTLHLFKLLGDLGVNILRRVANTITSIIKNYTTLLERWEKFISVNISKLNEKAFLNTKLKVVNNEILNQRIILLDKLFKTLDNAEAICNSNIHDDYRNYKLDDFDDILNSLISVRVNINTGISQKIANKQTIEELGYDVNTIKNYIGKTKFIIKYSTPLKVKMLKAKIDRYVSSIQHLISNINESDMTSAEEKLLNESKVKLLRMSFISKLVPVSYNLGDGIISTLLTLCKAIDHNIQYSYSYSKNDENYGYDSFYNTDASKIDITVEKVEGDANRENIGVAFDVEDDDKYVDYAQKEESTESLKEDRQQLISSIITNYNEVLRDYSDLVPYLKEFVDLNKVTSNFVKGLKNTTKLFKYQFYKNNDDVFNNVSHSLSVSRFRNFLKQLSEKCDLKGYMLHYYQDLDRELDFSPIEVYVSRTVSSKDFESSNDEQ